MRKVKYVTLPGLLAAYREFKAHPETPYRINIWPDEIWTWTEFRAWFVDCLNRKINVLGGDVQRGRKDTLQYRLDPASDVRTIRDYFQRRIRHSGCCNILRTAELQARYPHINTQPMEDF